MNEAVRLEELQKKYTARGLKLVVISPFELSVLRERLLGEYGAKYWIGCDPRLETTISFIVPNTPAEFPMQYLVDIRGTIVNHGDSLDAKIEELLEEVFIPDLRRDLHRALSSARRTYDKGLIGSAWKTAGAKLDDEDPTVVADATFLRERCEEYAAWKQRMIQRALDQGQYGIAMKDLGETEKIFRSMPVANWARERRGELRKDPKVKLELKAWALLEKAMAKEEKADGDPKKMRSVRKLYRSIAEKHRGTAAAKEAQRRLAR